MLVFLSYTFLPSSEIVPESGFSNPAIIRSKVVLPQPLGPRMDTISPLFIDNETSDTAIEFPNILLMFLHTNVEFKVSA